MNNQKVKDMRRQQDELGTDFRIMGNIEDMPDVTCKACGGKTFINGVQVKRVPGMVNSTGKDQFVPKAVLVCAAKDCGALKDS